MRALRSGFTLIELLIVIVIIGILAAVAIPKLNRARERSYFNAMQSDLRNLMNQQEMYWSLPANNYNYASNLSSLSNAVLSNGVTVDIISAGQTGWGATAGHQGLLATQVCAVFLGTVAALPAPAATPGIVTCTNS